MRAEQLLFSRPGLERALNDARHNWHAGASDDQRGAGFDWLQLTVFRTGAFGEDIQHRALLESADHYLNCAYVAGALADREGVERTDQPTEIAIGEQFALSQITH